MNTFIRAVEYWVPSHDRSILEFGGGHYGNAPRLASVSRSLCFGRGEGTIGQVFLTGIPAVADLGQGSDPTLATVAFPVLRHGRLTAVMALYL